MHINCKDSDTGFYDLRALLFWFIVGSTENKKLYFLEYSNIMDFFGYFSIFLWFKKVHTAMDIGCNDREP